MSIYPQRGARGLERLIWLKYNIVFKRGNTFISGLNAAKNTRRIYKSLKQKSVGINFVQKRQQVYMSIYPQRGARGLERLIWLKYYTERQITFNLGLNYDKNTD